MNIDGVDISLDNLTQDLLELLVGERWPNGDEGAMRSLASAWSDAATQLDEIRQTASSAAQQVGEYCQGANADAFQAFWSANFDDGQTSWPSGVAPAALPFAVQFCKAMASALTAGANQIETTKDMIMGNIAILVATVTPQIAAGFFDFGATDATAVAEVLADRTVMQALLDGAKDLIVEMVEQAIEQGLMQAELAFVIQFKEVMEGHAGSIDWGQVGQAGLSGAEGGALGAGFGFGIGKAGGKIFGEDFGKSFAGRAAAGVASGGLTNAGLDLLQNGHISASDFTKGSLAGVLGGMGGAEAAAGEKPAVDTENLPTELKTPELNTPDLTTPRTADVPTGAPGARTDLSGLMAPPSDHGTATIDNAAPSVDPTGTAVSADVSGGAPVDPSQASAAASSAARFMSGGHTEDASVGVGAATGFAESPAATSAPAASGGGNVAMDAHGFQEPAGSGGLGSLGSTGSGESLGTARFGADAAVGGGASAAPGLGGGMRATEATPTSARSDFASTGGSGYGSVREAPASARSDAGGTSTSGYGSVGELGAEANTGSRAGAPSALDTGAVDAGVSGPIDTASSVRQNPDTGAGAGDGVSGGLPVAGGGSMAADAVGGRSSSGDPSTGAGGGSSSGRFYGGRGSVLDRTAAPAEGSGDRATNLGTERTAVSPDSLNLADPRATDRAATGPSEPSAGSIRQDPVADMAGRPGPAPDDSAARSQEPQGQQGSHDAAVPADPFRSESPAESARSEQSADPSGSEHAAESGGATVTADDSGSRGPQSDIADVGASEPSGPVAEGSRPDPDRPEQPEPTEQPSDPAPWTEGAEPVGPASDAAQPEAGPTSGTGARDVRTGLDSGSDTGARPDARTTSDGTSDTGTKPGSDGNPAAAKPDSGVRPDQRASAPDAAKPEGARPDAPANDADRNPPRNDADRNTPGNGADRNTPRNDADRNTPGNDADRNAPGNGADRGGSDPRGTQQSPDATGRPDGSAPSPDARHDTTTLIASDPGILAHDPSADAAAWAPPIQAGGLSDRLAAVNARAEVGDRGISMFADPEMAALSRLVEPDPSGAFDLNLHGDASGGISGLDRLSPQDLLDLADANGHQPGQPFRLTSCEAGAVDHGFAAELSRISGCKVIAADSLVWTDSAGHMFASKSHVDGFGESVPDIPPSGHWVEFSPDGTKLPIGENGFPPGQESGFGGWNTPVGDVRARGTDAPSWAPPEPVQELKVPDPADPALRPLAPGDRFSDRSDLPASAKIDVVDTNGEPRGTFYTDQNGKITHAELPVPNTRHGEQQTPSNPDPYQRHGLTEQNVVDGSNPDAATPPGDATVKYTWGDKSVVFKTDAEGEPQPPAVWDTTKWDADAAAPKATFKLGPRQSVFDIKPGKLEPGSYYTAEQTPKGESTPRVTKFWTDGSGKVVAVDTWKGRDDPASADEGGWNPNLGAYGRAKGPDGMRFRPDVTFRVDGKVGATDGFGRMTAMSLDHGASIADPLTPSVRNESAQGESNSFGKAEHPSGEWDGGHKYPAAVGGPSEPFNYFPQDRDSNQGNGADVANSWWTDEMDTVAGIKYQQATVSGWDIIESHRTGTPGDPSTVPPTPPEFNKTPELVIVRKTYRFPLANGEPGPPRTTIRFTINVEPTTP
ncbi:MAG TPA: hypothetical protein VFN97_14560 [Actinospica sp.]|nr:hypothetical protein [Actinospica sp.]